MALKVPPEFTFVLLLSILASSFTIQEAGGYKILSLSMFSSKSHKITYEKLLLELAERGHEVTYLGLLPSGKNITTLREYKTGDIDAQMKDLPNIFELRLNPLVEVASFLLNPFLLFGGTQTKLCREFYNLPIVKQIQNEKFDLVFIVPFFNECLLGLVHKLNVPYIIYTSTQVLPWIASDVGSPACPSFVPNLSYGFSDRMSFLQRLGNMLGNMYYDLSLRWYYYPLVHKIYQEELGDPTLPGPEEIVKNVSLVLANSHISFDKPRPQMPDIIDVGGLYMVPAKPLPKDLDEFFAGAGEHGVIFFSMGSAAKGILMPESYRKMFLNVFSKLKQRVLWKWETEKMDDLPPNVKLSKWVPQQDVLGDKRLRLFITHGGHGSTTEAIYHGVPLIGIPLIGDQTGNMAKAAKAGFALPPLSLPNLTEETLLDAINKILSDQSYRENAQRLSRIYRDQPEKPLDRAVYWIEYVIRHQGATHLRSAARELNNFQYYSVDIVLTLLALLVVTGYIQFIILRAILQKCFRSRKQVGGAKKSQ